MPPEAKDAGRRELAGIAVRRSLAAAPLAIAEWRSQTVAVFLASVAVAIHANVVVDGRPGSWSRIVLIMQLAGMAVAAWWFRRSTRQHGRELIVSPLLVLTAVFAFVYEGLSRSLFGVGHPFEIVTMSAARNLVMGLAVVSVSPAYQKLAVVLSLFLAMFGVTASRSIATQWMAGVFAAGAVVWLSASYWDSVRSRLHGNERSRMPRWGLLVLAGLLLAICGGFAAGDRRTLAALRGFLPSSGGTGQSDSFARDGVGDGEMLVAGTEQIQTFGPIEDAPFLQDDNPSLYDMFDETYEEEVVRPRDQDRAIPLPPALASRVKQHLHTRTEKAHREFSILRQKTDPDQRRRVESLNSDALFYVAGRVPLHLRLQVYDLFDGETWYPADEPTGRPPLEMQTSGGKPWLTLQDHGTPGRCEFLGPAETHALKIVKLDTNVVPSPLYLHGVHIDLVDRADLFDYGPDGLVAMQRESLPSLVPIHLASRPIDRDALVSKPPKIIQVHSDRATSVIPPGIDAERLRRLALDRARGANDSWSKIASIIDHLRGNYEVDGDWRPHPSSQSAVEQFLFESRRGPDYQFATAAALLLRSLGFHTRVVSGFYVDPEQYDNDSRHTPVMADDVHFWVEVRVTLNEWVTLEATPGYQVLGPPPGFWQRIQVALGAVTVFCVKHRAALAGCGILAAVIWSCRRWIADGLATLWWRWQVFRRAHQAVAVTVSLLQKRAALAGCPQGTAVTYSRWIRPWISATHDSASAAVMQEFLRAIDKAAYGSGSLQPMETCKPLCLQIAGFCTLKWFRQVVVPSENSPE